MSPDPSGYLHGYSEHERDRLHRQARFLEPMVHDRLPFRRRRSCSRSARASARRPRSCSGTFPRSTSPASRSTRADRRGAPLSRDGAVGDRSLRDLERRRDAPRRSSPRASTARSSAGSSSTSAIPARVLSEVRRVLSPGAPVVCNEVLNATFFIDPYSPDTLRYWMAFNDHQLRSAAIRSSARSSATCSSPSASATSQPRSETFHLDNRAPAERAEFLAYWTELLLSGAAGCSLRQASRRRSSTA